MRSLGGPPYTVMWGPLEAMGGPLFKSGGAPVAVPCGGLEAPLQICLGAPKDTLWGPLSVHARALWGPTYRPHIYARVGPPPPWGTLVPP